MGINWQKVMIKDGDEKIVYSVMDKIEPGGEIGKRKKEMLENRKMLKEFVKIGVFRGIFRVSDFNGRNVLIKNGFLQLGNLLIYLNRILQNIRGQNMQ